MRTAHGCRQYVSLLNKMVDDVILGKQNMHVVVSLQAYALTPYEVYAVNIQVVWRLFRHYYLRRSGN